MAVGTDQAERDALATRIGAATRLRRAPTHA